MKDRKADRDDDLEPTGEENLAETEIVDEEEAYNDKLKRLRSKLESCEEDKRQYLEDLQRTRADFLNSKKRLEATLATDKERLTNDFVLEILPLCDSFDMAMSNTEAWQAVDETWRSGIVAIYSQLQSLLQSYQVKPIEPIGEAFNPQEHEAVSNVTVTEAEKNNQVMSVLQKGYVREKDGKRIVVRPARVTVGQTK